MTPEIKCNCLMGNPNIVGPADNCPIHGKQSPSQQAARYRDVLEKIEEKVKEKGFGSDPNKQADLYLFIRDVLSGEGERTEPSHQVGDVGEQEAVKFAEWVGDNHYTYNRPSKKYISEDFQIHEPEQLYQLFKQSTRIQST